MKSKDAAELCEWAAVLNRVEQDQAGRAGLGGGTLRVLIRCFALLSSGATVRGVDLNHGHAAAVAETRRNLVLLLQAGLITRERTRGPLGVTPEGQRLCKDFAAAWTRARRQFAGFSDSAPYLRVKPRKTA